MNASLKGVGKIPKGTMHAIWLLSMAIVLANGNKQCVHLIEDLRILWQSIHHKLLNLSVGFVALDEQVSCENTARIGAHDKHRLIARVEENRIGRLRPDSWDLEELSAQDRGVGSEHPIWPGAVGGAVPPTKPL